MSERLYHLPQDCSVLRNDAMLEEVIDQLRRAKASGFTAGVLYYPSEIVFPSRTGEEYVGRLKQLSEEAAKLELGLVPYVMNFGNGQSLLRYYPDLAEGMPVRDALFVVEGQESRLIPDPPIIIKNPGIEEMDGDRLVGWNDELGLAGRGWTVDTEAFHNGKQSVRFDAAGKNEQGWMRLTQQVALQPFRQYRARVWLKTESEPGALKPDLQLWTGRRQLHHAGNTAEATQDWQAYEFAFNSQDHTEATLRLEVSAQGDSGCVWFDDVEIHEIGMLNIVRRSGCPLVVRAEDGTEYEEGRDYEAVADPMLNQLHPWGGWSFSHEPPSLRLTEGSRLQDGQRLRVSFYHAAEVYGHQVSICMSCDEAYERFGESVREIDGLLHPVGYHISLGEIRNANWDASCQERGLSSAEIMADSIRRRIEIIRKVNPKARIYAWSDMLDPNQNARDNYYLVNGSYEGAAELAPQDVVIVNWNYLGYEGKSPAYFADRGFTQLLCGTPGTDVAQYLDQTQPLPKGIVGVYAFGALRPEAFAEAVWRGGDQ